MKCPEAVCENHDGERGDCGLHIYLYKLIKNVIMENSTKRFLKKWRALAAIFFLAAFATSVQAQNVTIRANNGSTVAAVKDGGTTDTFFNLGGFATWQHEQLSMVLTTSDGTDLTPNGQLDNPANNLFANGEYMQIAKGQAGGANVCYVTLSLPKGYRFTGYSITFTKPRNAQGSEFNTGQAGNQESTFGETNSTFASYTTQATIAINGSAQTISRTEMTEGDMGNVLYFKLQNPTNNRALIQLDNAEFFFTSEENYSPVLPAATVSEVSAVDIPFATSKVDFGAITSRSYNGVTRVSYSSANVTDLEANFKLFEAESVENGTDIDGITGKKVVKYDDGTISSEGGYFKLGREGQEQIYYIETPTYVEVSDGTKVPVGYRIIGAEFEYANKITASRTFRIAYTTTGYGGGTTYYLNTNGRFTTTQVTWEMDADGYISSGGNYLYFNNGYAATQTTKPDESERFGIDDNNNIYQLDYPTYFITYYSTGGYGATRYGLISNTSGNKAVYQEISTSTETLDFTFEVYDKTGKSVAATRTDGNGKVTLSGLNNDAVKFSVQGIGLVRATLTLQALDPYLNSMNVICQDQEEEAIRMTQNFTASDFSVSGGEFYFYLPEEAADHEVLISFEDLESKYFDETYDGGDASHTSRINFVKSDHYNKFGASQNSIYNDVSEAENAQEERLKVNTVGTAAFKFNNVDEVGSSGGTLTEYPFSLEKYKDEGGSFDQMRFTVSEEDQQLTRYVFTTDETRYNISPATATQHRAYAFYQMIVHVQTATYVPTVKFTKVYDKTLYRELLTDEETGEKSYGGAKTDAFYGVEVTAVDGNGNPGYASTNKIFELIAKAIEDGKDDFGNTDLPSDPKFILYLDFSQLKGIYMITDEEHPSMDAYSGTNAANCMIFLPAGSSAPNNNVAAKQTGSSTVFNAANDIVLTDMQPFYTPYDIQVRSTNMASYERKITKSTYGTVSKASVIMPFELTVSNGTHTNEDGSTITLHTMQSNAALTQIDGTTYAYFPELSEVSKTEPNTPYMVVVGSNTAEEGSFIISQKGTLIKATTGMDKTKYTFDGEEASGVNAAAGDAQGSYTFTNKGTYAGLKIAKADNVFYFAKDMFVSSKNLDDAYSYANIAPFRAFYATGNLSSGAKLMNFGVILGEGEGDVPTAIHAVDAAQIIDVNAPVYDLQGRMVAPAYRDVAGKKLAAGMYVVNGVKFIVK